MKGKESCDMIHIGKNSSLTFTSKPLNNRGQWVVALVMMKMFVVHDVEVEPPQVLVVQVKRSNEVVDQPR